MSAAEFIRDLEKQRGGGTMNAADVRYEVHACPVGSNTARWFIEFGDEAEANDAALKLARQTDIGKVRVVKRKVVEARR